VKLSNKAQEEQLKEIVAHLQQVREQHSVRIEELAAYTRIRLAFLQALEEGRFEDLPEPVYVQGFIRHYGDAIGLDGSALAKNVARICTPPEQDNDNREVEKKPNVYIPLAIPYILLLAAASFGLLYVLNLQGSSESVVQKNISPATSEEKTASELQTSSTAKTFPTPHSSPITKANEPIIATTPETSSLVTTPPILTESPTAETSVPATAPTPEASSREEATPSVMESPKTTRPVEVAIELQDQSWLRVKVDGKTEFEGILDKGERKSWTAEKELEIRSGNAGAVLVSANNGEQTPLGTMGSVKQVKFTSEMVNGQ
jgi:cytoskeletal protein RodZ